MVQNCWDEMVFEYRFYTRAYIFIDFIIIIIIRSRILIVAAVCREFYASKVACHPVKKI